MKNWTDEEVRAHIINMDTELNLFQSVYRKLAIDSRKVHGKTYIYLHLETIRANQMFHPVFDDTIEYYVKQDTKKWLHGFREHRIARVDGANITSLDLDKLTKGTKIILTGKLYNADNCTK